MTTREKVDRVEDLVRDAADSDAVPTLTTTEAYPANPPAIRLVQPDGSVTEYLSRPVFDQAAAAIGSNTRSEFNKVSRQVWQQFGIQGTGEVHHVQPQSFGEGAGGPARQFDDDF